MNRDDLNQTLVKASSEAAQRIRDVLELRRVQSEIRGLIGRANTHKVSELLTERDCLNSQEKTLVEILGIKKEDEPTRRSRRLYGDMSSENVKIEHDHRTLVATVDNLRARSTTLTTGTVPGIELPVLSPEAYVTFENDLATIRRRRTDLMDELAAANLSQKIVLSERIVKVLQNHRIL